MNKWIDKYVLHATVASCKYQSQSLADAVMNDFAFFLHSIRQAKKT